MGLGRVKERPVHWRSTRIMPKSGLRAAAAAPPRVTVRETAPNKPVYIGQYPVCAKKNIGQFQYTDDHARFRFQYAAFHLGILP